MIIILFTAANVVPLLLCSFVSLSRAELWGSSKIILKKNPKQQTNCDSSCAFFVFEAGYNGKRSTEDVLEILCLSSDVQLEKD